MNDSIIIAKLNNQIKSLNIELEKNKKYISNLELSLLQSQNKYAELQSKYFLNSSKEIEYQKLKINLKEKDILISELEKELTKTRKNYENETRAFNIKYQHDIREAQFLNGKLNQKIENTSKIEKLNDLLYSHTLLLEQKILDFKKDEQKRMQEKEIEFEKRVNEIKKKMLDYIREGKNLKDKSEQEQNQILQKFSIMNHNTLLNELEFESLQLEDLLKQRAHLDNIILKIKSDLEIHKKVEKKLINKNKKYIDMIRMLSIKIDEKKIGNENEYINDNKKNNNIEKKFLFNESSKNFFSNKITKKNNYKNNISFDKNEFNKTQPLIKIIKDQDNIAYKFKKLNRVFSCNSLDIEKQKNINKEKVLINKLDLQKELIKITKELKDSKSYCEYYKEKLDLINDKYKNIINMFDEALNKVYEDKKIENIKDIYIDLNEFKKCNFEKLSKEKRYSLIVLLIQYIIPLINKDNLPDNIKNKNININIKIYSNKTSDTSNRLTKNESFYGNKIKINGDDLKKIRNNILNGKFKNKRNKYINVNNNKKYTNSQLKGNISSDNLFKNYSEVFYKINPPFDFKSFNQ